ncbi:MAG: hypothetical protein QOI12_3678 [Alphaproteobacteria bacterium]|jgi:hypothetical protein|nr:hypothetical protein [Alphaproteobacteria bacterium]
MGVDLISGHGDFSLHWGAWRSCFELAITFGWQPAGTVAPCNYLGPGHWNRSYFTNDRQVVSDDDARALAMALRRACTALRTNQSVTREQAEALADLDMEMVCNLAGYAKKGHFAIL